MTYLSRRRFLRVTSVGVGLVASTQFLPIRWVRAQSPEGLIQARPYEEPRLRALALVALDAAREAGAKFADVRILVGHAFSMQATSALGLDTPSLQTSLRMGVRAVVGGTVGFAGQVLDLDADKVASLARIAVRRSRAGESNKGRAFEFVPAPVVANGSWQTPIEIDPFTEPVGEQESQIMDALDTAGNVKANAAMGFSSSVLWLRRDEIFASSEGSYINQRMYTAFLDASVSLRSGRHGESSISQGVKTPSVGGRGYEALSKANLKGELLRVAEEVARMNRLPVKNVDVGRYDLVLGTGATAALLTNTIAGPLELDRALLLTTNTTGTTYAMPPANILGKFRLGSPLVSVRADRSQPGAIGTVGWDSEGVVPEDFNLVKEGIVVDYLTTRETAPALRAWYESLGKPIRSHGCASGSGGLQPSVSIPNLTFSPGSSQTSVDELIKDVKHGFYLANAGAIGNDQSNLNVQVQPPVVEEIIDGRLTGLVKNMSFQFTTPQFWRSVDAIGGSRSLAIEHIPVSPIDTELLGTVAVSAVPIRVRKVNVVNIGKRA
jgi:TldD protein